MANLITPKLWVLFYRAMIWLNDPDVCGGLC
jgi:hypothetical protein